MSENGKRYIVLLACLVSLVCLGTAAAWSVYVLPLMHQSGLSKVQTQVVPALSSFSFCVCMIVGGRLQDRFGPRPVALAGAAMLGLSYLLSWLLPAEMLWLSMGLLAGVGNSTGYTPPIATAIKYFPNRRGLVAGLAAASFAVGPILVQKFASALLAAGWQVRDIFGLIGLIYVPVLLACAMLLKNPPGAAATFRRGGFRTKMLLEDRRFWLLFFGMLCGTFPFLLLTGNLQTMAGVWFAGWVAALAIPAIAGGNALGRIFWGYLLDHIGTRKAMLGFEGLLVLATGAMLVSSGHWAIFLGAALMAGFCHGANFAIYPTTLARLYGPELLGTTYPWVMVAQGISSVAPLVGGAMWAATGGFQAALGVSAGVAVLGLGLSAWLGHAQQLAPQSPLRIVQPLSAGAKPDVESAK